MDDYHGRFNGCRYLRVRLDLARTLEDVIEPRASVPSDALGATARTRPAWLRASVPASWLQIGMLLTALVAFPFANSIDNDFWWHLRTGEFIVHHGIPSHDPYSWTKAGQPWVLHEWLSEVLIYVSQANFGYAVTYLLFGLVTVGALLGTYTIARRAGTGTRPLTALMLLVLLVLCSFVTVRPQVLTWAMFSAFLYILSRHDDGEKTPIWLLPPLMAVWVNLHLGFYFGLMLVGCWLAALCFDAVRGRAVPLRLPFAVAGACVLATFANPAGPRILAYPLRYATDSQATARVAEWQQPSIFDISHLPIFLVALLLAWALVSRTRPRPFLMLVALAAIVLSMQAIRNAPFAVLVLLPVVGGAAARRWSWASSARDTNVRVPFAAAAGLVLAVGMMLGPVALARTGGDLSLRAPSDDGYPAAGAAFVRLHHPGARLFNDYNNGGYLIYALYPDVPVFVDGRTDFYGNQVVEDFFSIQAAHTGWDERLRAYGVEVALIDDRSALAPAMAAASDWRLEFSEGHQAVYAPQ